MANAANEREFHAAFAKVVQAGAGGLLILSTVFFASQRRQLAALAARHALPTVYNGREYAEVGGLIGYGPSQSDAYRRAGVYVGRILTGRPRALPGINRAGPQAVMRRFLLRCTPPTYSRAAIVSRDLGLGVSPHEAARLHHAHWRCNGCMAACGARATGGDARGGVHPR